MPTCGWIREDGLEAFNEGAERLSDPGSSSDSCFRYLFCTNSYESSYGLHAHVSAGRKVECPVLLIRGKEPPKRTTVRTQMVQRFLRRTGPIRQWGEDG